MDALFCAEWSDACGANVVIIFFPFHRINAAQCEGRMGMLTQHPLPHRLVRCWAGVGSLAWDTAFDMHMWVSR